MTENDWCQLAEPYCLLAVSTCFMVTAHWWKLISNTKVITIWASVFKTYAHVSKPRPTCPKSSNTDASKSLINQSNHLQWPVSLYILIYLYVSLPSTQGRFLGMLGEAFSFESISLISLSLMATTAWSNNAAVVCFFGFPHIPNSTHLWAKFGLFIPLSTTIK